jgi:hypothetical protein
MRSIFLFTLILILLSGCASSPRVNTDFDTKASFLNLNTFAFAPESADSEEVTTLLSKRVRDALTDGLKQRGKSLVEETQADFLVAYHTSTEKRIDIDNYYAVWGFRPHWWYGPYHHAGHLPTTRVREYKVGTLVVDVIDTKSKSVIWSSSAQNTLSKYLSPQEREEKVRNVVSAMLDEFPPTTTI